MKSWRAGFVLGTIMTLAVPASSSNSSFEKATPLVCPFDISAELSTTADRNFYVVKATQGSLVFIWSEGSSGLKAVVYDEWGRWVGYLDRIANVCDVRVFVPGQYYVEVFSADGITHGKFHITGQQWPLGPERDGGRLHLNFDVPGHEFVARSLIPLIARRMEAELAPYSCAVVTSKELPQEQATGEWVGVQVGPGPRVGGGTWGDRRPSGGCAAGWSGVGAEESLWQTLFGDPGVVSHESWHGFGIPHMGWGSASAIQFDYGWNLLSYNYWSRVWNLREYMTLICQAGYLGVEIEPNNDLSTATDVNPWLEQMRKDNLQTNNAFMASGKISDGSDVDICSLTVRAGERWQFDIDAAEFQYSLDAYLLNFA